MKHIVIAFDGFWEGFDYHNNFITNLLKKYYNVEIITSSEDRNRVQYLFYSVYSKMYVFYDCVRIFYTGENQVPDFNFCDYAIGFEKMQIYDRYIRFPLYFAEYLDDYHRLEKKHQITEQDISCKTGFCATVVSNAINADSFRDSFFNYLSEYKTVDSGGRHLNNIGVPNGVDNKLDFMSKYKFSLAFENSSHTGYCTEKIVQSFAAKTVPIYWGDPEVDKYFNEKSFINCHKYSNIDEIINDIERIDNNNILFETMLREPAIINQNESYESYNNCFTKWMCNIINQEYCDAFRRSKTGRGKMLNDGIKISLDISSEIKPKIKIYNSMRLLKRLPKIFKNK